MCRFFVQIPTEFVHKSSSDFRNIYLNITIGRNLHVYKIKNTNIIQLTLDKIDNFSYLHSTLDKIENSSYLHLTLDKNENDLHYETCHLQIWSLVVTFINI